MGARILVVDDEPSARLLLDRVLTKAGHEVRTVASCDAASTLLECERFDVLLVDKNLPDGSGFDVIARARALDPRVAAIMISAHPDPLLASSVKLQGYLAKPFESPTRIVDTVARVLELTALVQPPRVTSEDAAPPHE